MDDHMPLQSTALPTELSKDDWNGKCQHQAFSQPDDLTTGNWLRNMGWFIMQTYLCKNNSQSPVSESKCDLFCKHTRQFVHLHAFRIANTCIINQYMWIEMGHRACVCPSQVLIVLFMHAILNTCWSCTSLRKVWSAIWCVSTSDLEYFSTDCPPYMDRQCWLAKHYGSVEWPKPEPPPLTLLERLITWSGDVCSIIPGIPCSQNMHHTREKHAKTPGTRLIKVVVISVTYHLPLTLTAIWIWI